MCVYMHVHIRVYYYVCIMCKYTHACMCIYNCVCVDMCLSVCGQQARVINRDQNTILAGPQVENVTA